VLGERLTVQMAAAFVLILGGSVLATRAARRPDSDVRGLPEPDTAAAGQYQQARSSGPD
jgi:hypothetical protein